MRGAGGRAVVIGEYILTATPGIKSGAQWWNVRGEAPQGRCAVGNSRRGD